MLLKLSDAVIVGGVLGEVVGIFEDELMCMLMVVWVF